MVNLSEDIQCAGSDTRLPMLDRTDFASWQQRIRLYCREKENGVNILKSIDEGPFQMGTFRETLTEENEGALHLGFELTKEDRESQLYDDFEHFCQKKGETIHDYHVRFAKLINDMQNIKMIMSRMQLNSKFVNNILPDWGRFVTAVKLNRGLKESNYDQLYAYLKQHEAHANENKMMLEQFTQHTVDPLALMSTVLPQQYSSQSSTTLPSTYVPPVAHQPHFADNIQLDLGLSPTDNLIKILTNTLDLLTQSYKTVDKIEVRGTMQGVQCTQPKRLHNSEYFKDKMLLMQAQENSVVLDEEQLLFLVGGHDNAIDEDMDEPPVQDLTLNVDNIFQADECDAFDSDIDEAPTAQTMFMAKLSSPNPVYDEANLSYNSNILFEVQDHDKYQDVVCEQTILLTQMLNIRVITIIPYDQYVKDNNKVVNASLTAKLAIYKEQVELYERRAKFELTERERKIDEQLRIVITDRNIKEETLKKELHAIKIQLNSTINHNKSMVEEVTNLKKDFKQKENKFLKELLDMIALKEKLKDKLFKQDQSLQIVHMLCKPKPHYDEQRKVAIGYKNPLYLTRAKQVQPALYNGHKIVKTHHVPAIIYNSEDTIEIAKITRKKMNDKMKTPLWMERNIKIRPLDYSKENYLATFIPHTQLTPEQIFWSKDVLKIKAKALKEQTKTSKPITALTVYPPNTPAKLIHRVLPTKKVFYIATNSELTISRFSEMHDSYTAVQARCLELETKLSKLKDKIQKDDHNEMVKHFSHLEEIRSEADRTLDFRALDFQITQLTEQVIVLQEQNKLFRAENAKVKQHYKELYDSIKITHAKHIEQTTALITKNENLKVQINEKMKCVTMDSVKPKVLAPGMYAINVEPIPSLCRNNREAHLDYLKHLKESVETLREIVEEARVERPLDRSLASACLYTKQSQELLEYVIGTCPKDFNNRDKKQGKLLTNVGYQWKPMGRTFTLGEQCPLTRLTKSKVVPVQQTENVSTSNTMITEKLSSISQKPLTRYQCRNKQYKAIPASIPTPTKNEAIDASSSYRSSFVRFKNDHFGAIMGYEDYVIGDSVISRHSCYVRDTNGVELNKGSRGSNLYTISVEDMIKSSPICLLSKASKNKSWLWHRHLNHLNFDTINDLARKDLVRGLPILKYEKDHLYSACQLGKSKKHTHKPKAENTIMEVLYTLHIDLYGLMRVQSINEKK
ncbi:integrase, catalytic region, zinc finger, CCHC-type containing protein [Tanacetum coccineum]|uniref:Integrase, catalytic region, zinc finger, CCHC-type containing protein n=1 Tax=Tanacetum coccineum TaxID=301880 RepID=A0ABQ5CGD6_9ASTR